MGTPKKGELSRQIRAASAQLRSPCRPAPQAPQSQALIRAAVTNAGRPTVIEYSSPCAAAEPQTSLTVTVQESPAHVDLRCLRLQMERSLARLQSGEISPPPFKPPLATKALAFALSLAGPLTGEQQVARTDEQKKNRHSVRPSVDRGAWASTVAELFWLRCKRHLVHMILLRWSEVTGREKREELEHVVSQLEGELDAAEMLLAEYKDPARTQALDELALQMIDKDMALEKEQAERQREREQWEREREWERAEWEKERGTWEEARSPELATAWARAKEENEALGQLLDEERQAQVSPHSCPMPPCKLL